MEPLRITPSYDLLLRGSSAVPLGLYQLHLLTAEQLTRLHYKPGTLKTVQKRLKELTDHGFIQADRVPSSKPKSPFYYTLGAKGVRYLTDIGIDVSQSWRAARETNKHYLFIDHALEINDLLIAAASVNRVSPSIVLASYIHERDLKRHPLQTEWTLNGHKHTISLIPDSYLRFRAVQPDGRTAISRVLLEHDRGTEQQYHFRRRIRGYITLYKSGVLLRTFGAEKVITVAFTTFEGEKRLQQMRRWTEAELQATNEPRELGMMFCFGSFTKPPEPRTTWLGEHWYAAYEDVMQPFTLLGCDNV